MFSKNKENIDNDSISAFSEDNRYIELRISVETYESGFKKWKEMKTTPPSWRHLKLYATLLHITEFKEIFKHMCVLPTQYQFSPKR